MSSPKIVLRGMGPKLEGLQWESDTMLRIGRQGSVDVVLRDFGVDRLQAEVRWAGTRWVIRDLAQSETYPTIVNGKPLGRGDQILAANDVIQFGKSQLRVSILDETETPAAASGGAVLNGHKNGHVNGHSVNGHLVNGHLNGHAKVLDQASSKIVPPAVPAPPPSEIFPSQRIPEGQESIKTSGAFVKVQARTHQSWSQALELVAFGTEQRPQQSRAMLTLLRANHHLVHLANLEELVSSILQEALTALGAQRGSIALFDETTGRLELKANLAPNLSPSIKFIYSKTLAERCFRLGESLLCQDVNADDDLQMARSVRQGSMASIICALLRSPRKRIGILQMDRGPFQEPFVENDLYLVDAIAASAAIGIESAARGTTARPVRANGILVGPCRVDAGSAHGGPHATRDGLRARPGG